MIKVIEVKLQKFGALRALVSVMVGQTRINGYRVVGQEGQKTFVQPPQIVGVKDGKEAFFGPVVVFSDNIAASVHAAVLEAYHQKIENTP